MPERPAPVLRAVDDDDETRPRPVAMPSVPAGDRAAPDSAPAATPQVVSLDAFRKRKD